MSTKILKLKFEGQDFGYVRLNKSGTFYGDGSESQAVEFQQVKYKNTNDTFYYKVAGTKDSYMDFSLTSSIVKVTKPFFSVEKSSICAWKLVDGELHAVLSGKDTTKAISRSKHDPESKVLYANTFIDGNHCEVSIQNATDKSSNAVKDELKHALV
ncbi:hypothetical protein [Photobacterium galatheae]|uniref:Uncharacterized protein n=1 Tax=Photobacterium galatheae TaxID=1654360 RepID=A0A066RJ75_9GAMM|nr:hypothetical protein [Photobacterium galatheae]KDM90379.1 hypothetical protein EA58_16750 [Photobacterium galatheae]MCM0147902.1 hypothetical protein [Photobacterium galatheae]